MVLMNINDIVFDPLIYPRQLHEGRDGTLEPYWRSAAKMARAQRAGDILPPICVTKLKDRIVLIDGYNRLLAHRQNDKTEIEAEFIECANENEAFVQAVKRNVTHGVSLDDYEVAKAALRLQDLGYSELQISTIVSIPPLELRRMMDQRVVKTSGGNLVLKRLFVGQQLPSNMTDEKQNLYSVQRQLDLLRQLNALIDNDLLDLVSDEVRNELQKLYGSLRKMMRRP